MTKISFQQLQLANISEDEAIARAKDFIAGMWLYTGTEYSLEEALSTVIETAIEANHGA